MPASLAPLVPFDLPGAHVALLREWIGAYIDHRLNLGHRRASIDGDLRYFEQFVRFAGPRFWTWEDCAMDRYGAQLRRQQKSRSTLRRAQGAVKNVCAFGIRTRALNERCRALTGAPIPQICTPGNMLRHQYGAETTKRRHLTDDELAALFAAIESEIRSARTWFAEVARLSHHASIGMIFATGAREHEAAMLDVEDVNVATTAAVKGYSPYEDLTIRFGKAHNGGLPRRRSVVALYEFRSFWQELAWYVNEVRPRVAGGSAALFLTARGARYRGDSLSAAFTHYRNLAGLSPDLTLHCLRHTFATKLHELGYELPYISHLLGHSSEVLTVLYDHLDFDYLKRRVLLHNRQITRICRR